MRVVVTSAGWLLHPLFYAIGIALHRGAATWTPHLNAIEPWDEYLERQAFNPVAATSPRSTARTQPGQATPARSRCRSQSSVPPRAPRLAQVPAGAQLGPIRSL